MATQDALAYENIAECLAMCSGEEIKNRTQIETGSVSNFEQSHNGELSKELCIKIYQRSAADKEKKIPALLRPPIVIYHTIEYLRECVADQDRYPSNESFFKYSRGKTRHTFIDVYGFMRDRLRQLMQDLIVTGDECNRWNILATEQCCRFHLISYHDGALYKGSDGYDLTQNTERLTNSLSRLMNLYKLAKMKLQYHEISHSEYLELVSNKAEILSYLIIATSSNMEGVEYVMSLNFAEYPEPQQQQLKQAIFVRSVIESPCTHKFFKLLRSPRLNYFFACVMMIFVLSKREEAVTQLRKSVGSSQLPLGLISDKLGLSLADTETFVAACGYYTAEDGKRARVPNEKWKETLQKWTQLGPHIFLDEKRGQRSRALLMDGGSA